MVNGVPEMNVHVCATSPPSAVLLPQRHSIRFRLSLRRARFSLQPDVLLGHFDRHTKKRAERRDTACAINNGAGLD
jgi:hypothetical protein